MSWNSLSTRINSMPVIICGPILRKVTPESVTVWLALRYHGVVTLKVFDIDNGSVGEQIMSGTEYTAALGSNFSVVAVTAKIPDGQEALGPDQIYGYDLQVDGYTSLNTPGFWSADGDITGITYTSRGVTFSTPTFSLPPSSPENLRLLHGSCRKPHLSQWNLSAWHSLDTKDALASIDLDLQQTAHSAILRPHLLMLSGDQIYADDVATTLLHIIMDAADLLCDLGASELSAAPKRLQKDASDFIPGKRSWVSEGHYSIRGGNLTSSHASNHLIFFSEFCVMYLLVWSSKLWPDHLPEWEDIYPGTIPSSKKEKKQFEVDHIIVDRFRSEIESVQRVLANIPTYMMMDDHEVTDDWYLHYLWTRQVLRTNLESNQPESDPGHVGAMVIRNGLNAYALFQGWGNRPRDFEYEPSNDIPHGRVLIGLITQWLAMTDRKSEQTLVLEREIQQLLSIPTAETLSRNKSIRSHHEDNNTLIWHYVIQFEYFNLVVVDSRTWRSFGNRLQKDKPDILDSVAFKVQLEDELNKINSTTSITIIVLSTNLVVPRGIINTLDDMPISRTAIEAGDAWHPQSHASEQLLATLAKYSPQNGSSRRGRYIVLSGDIHMGYASRLHYWGTSPLGFVNEGVDEYEFVVASFTSSSIHNCDLLTVSNHGADEGRYHQLVQIVPELITKQVRTEIWGGYNVSTDDPTYTNTWSYFGSIGLEHDKSAWELITTSPPMVSLAYFENQEGALVKYPDWSYKVELVEAEVDYPDFYFSYSDYEYTSIASAVIHEFDKLFSSHQDTRNAAHGGRLIVGLNNIGEVNLECTSSGDIVGAQQKLTWHQSAENPLQKYTSLYRVSFESAEPETLNFPLASD